MTSSDLHISRQELQLMQDDTIFPLKQRIMEKMSALLAAFAGQLRQSPVYQTFPFPEGTDYQRGKISRGERYRDQPYLILDLPRLFTHDDIFACRTMFWWGNYFIFTLHLAGTPKQHFFPSENAIEQLKQIEGVYLYDADDPWHHAVEPPGYKPAGEITHTTVKRIINPGQHLKIARTLPLSCWEEVIETGVEFYERLFRLMRENSTPGY